MLLFRCIYDQPALQKRRLLIMVGAQTTTVRTSRSREKNREAPNEKLLLNRQMVCVAIAASRLVVTCSRSRSGITNSEVIAQLGFAHVIAPYKPTVGHIPPMWGT